MAGFWTLSVRGTSVHAYTNTSEYVSRLLLSPSAVARIADNDAFEKMLSAKSKPGSVILGIGSDGLTAENETSVGGISETFDTLAENGILPVIKLESVLYAQALSEAVTENDYYDFAIAGNDKNVLKKAKELMPEARVIMDFSEEKPFGDSYEYIQMCREVGGSTVILSQSAADRDTVYYLQSMMTTVWVIAASETRFGFASAISTGAYGIVANDFGTLFSVYDLYPVYSLPRGYYVVGHRGLPFTENENSLESCIAAYEAGATHFEIDVQSTADDKLVIMHDATINTTTNGSGAVSNMTLEEIQRYKIIKSDGWEGSGNELKIPTLADIFEYFQDKDVIIIVEIKDTKPVTCRLIKEEIERFEMQRKTVAISFFDADGSQLERMHDLMPSLPISSLNQPTESNFDEFMRRASRINMTFDPSYQTGYPTFFNSNLKDRGYMAWSWTYKDPSAVQLGITGITNDYADIFGKYAKRITAPDGLTVKPDEDISVKKFSAEKLNFDGTSETIEAKVFISEKTNGGYNAILTAETKDEENHLKVNVFSQPVFIAETSETDGPTEEEPAAQKKSCKNASAADIGTIGAFVFLSASAIGTSALLKRKKR